MGSLPSKSGFIAAKMSAARRPFIDRLKQVEVIDKGLWPQIKMIQNDLGNLVRGIFEVLEVSTIKETGCATPMA